MQHRRHPGLCSLCRLPAGLLGESLLQGGALTLQGGALSLQGRLSTAVAISLTLLRGSCCIGRAVLLRMLALRLLLSTLCAPGRLLRMLCVLWVHGWLLSALCMLCTPGRLLSMLCVLWVPSLKVARGSDSCRKARQQIRLSNNKTT